MSSLGTWGLDDVDELVYRAVLRHPGRSRDDLAGLIGRTYSEVVSAVRRLARLGLVESRGSGLTGRPPAEAFTGLLAAARADLLERERQLLDLRSMLPAFIDEYGAGERGSGSAPAVEIVAGAEAVQAVLAELSGHSEGELLTCLRPPMTPPPPGSPERERTFSDPDFAGGRPSRTIYRADFFEQREWWQAVRDMSAPNSLVRVATEVPTKLIVVSGYAAMIPLDFDSQDGNNGVLIRAPTLVGAVETLFELVWERAVPLSALEPPGGERRGDKGEADLLSLLAAGAKDETIARQLDVSVRTVRRHVAALLTALGARTRFQAGVQAVHRGWL